MSTYLERLKMLDRQKHLPEQPSKPSKAPFEGFESRRPESVSPARVPFEGFEGERSERISPPSRSDERVSAVAYNHARLQREADRRNAEAARSHSTDRFCRCGHLATFAWPDDAGRDVWICAECLPTRGRA